MFSRLYSNDENESAILADGISDDIPSDLPSSNSAPILSCLARTGKVINFGAISGLFAFTSFLFLQVQSLSRQVHSEQHQIDLLQKQIQSSTEVIEQQVEQQRDLTVVHIAGTFTLLSCLVTMFHMTAHLRNMNQGGVQRKVLAILWMSPVYAVTAFLSLLLNTANNNNSNANHAGAGAYLDIVKDFYEAYVIYQFLSFLIAVLGTGDRQRAVQVLSRYCHVDANKGTRPNDSSTAQVGAAADIVSLDQHDLAHNDRQGIFPHHDHGHHNLKKPYRWLNCLFPPNFESNQLSLSNAILLECQVLAMQFVFFRPFTSIVSFVLENTDNHTIKEHNYKALQYLISPQFFITVIENISVFFAFTGLLKFYHAVRDELAWCQPFAKFMTIKGVVFMTFWQGLIINILFHVNQSDVTDYSTSDTSSDSFEGNNTNNNTNSTDTTINNSTNDNTNNYNINSGSSISLPENIQHILICMEMLFFSVAHWCVFPAEEWQDDYKSRFYERQQSIPGFGFKEFASDVNLVIDCGKASLRARREERSNIRLGTGNVIINDAVENAARSEEQNLQGEMVGEIIEMDQEGGSNMVATPIMTGGGDGLSDQSAFALDNTTLNPRKDDSYLNDGMVV